MSGVRIAVLVSGCNLVLLLATLAQRGSASTQAAAAPLLRGRALELVDARGQIRARLDVEPGGQVVFRLLDGRGTIRVKLGADEDGSGLLLANDATEPGVHILADAGGSSIRVANKDGRARVVVP